MYKVRDFGNDRDYPSLADLIGGLASHYKGNSVAIHAQSARSEMVRVLFVDVDQEGVARNSYGPQAGHRLDYRCLRDLVEAGS